MIKITDAAAAQIRVAHNNPDVFEMVLRIAAYQEDNGDVNYGMGFDLEREADEHLVVNGIALLIAAPSTPYLQGVTLDFVEMSPGDMRFIFIPPYSAEPESDAGSGTSEATPAE
jgi:iron-sulfur cluster assembly protein